VSRENNISERDWSKRPLFGSRRRRYGHWLLLLILLLLAIVMFFSPSSVGAFLVSFLP
jgi:hypothetical protein